MADIAHYRKLLDEVETMRRRLDEIADALKKHIHSAGGAPDAAAAARSLSAADQVRRDAADALADPGAQAQGSSHVLEMLDLGDDFRRILTLLIRTGGMSAADVARETGDEEAAVRIFLKTLVTQGHVRKAVDAAGNESYLPVLGKSRTRAGDADVWKRLGM